MQSTLKKSRIVLLGIGHTNAHVVRMWKMNPLPNAELVCISNDPVATYSGMLPGVLSGQYPAEAMEIDLVRLCRSAGCRLIVDEVQSVDRERKEIRFERRSAIPYDLLSIGIGSRPDTSGAEIEPSAPVELIKPMPSFVRRFAARLSELKNRSPAAIKAIVVGGGVGGLEIGFCLSTRLQSSFPSIHSSVTVVTGGELGGGTAAATRRKLRAALRDRSIHVVELQKVRFVGLQSVRLENGEELQADLVLWATQAVAPELLAKIDVPKDDRGFLAIRSTLQSASDDSIFAVGDTGTMIDSPHPKAGVYAVRQAPILWENLSRSLSHRPLLNYVPQKNFLKLINTGDGQAIGEYWQRANRSRLMWRLKNGIDVKFMKKYQDYRLMARSEPPVPSASSMRCLGCGGKIGAASLRAALASLERSPAEGVLVGLDSPDDAAIISCPENQITATVDFFAAPFDDPYRIGQIAAVHASSDCFAMGAAPTSALAMVQIPFGHPRGQQRVLQEILSGAHDEFRRIGAAIVGGHTIEGPNTLVGFSVFARQTVPPLLKSGLRPGDRLILTKPLGTGVLLAAYMRNQCRGAWFVELIRQMQQGNDVCLKLAQRYSIKAMTDVTGFGLAGHLKEMLEASGLRATLDLSQITALPGSLELIAAGVESTLTPDNRAGLSGLEKPFPGSNEPLFDLLFDPQTCGGMLIGAARRDVDDILAELARAGFDWASVIGTVLERATPSGDRPLIEFGA